jgi:hypothetical protein
MKSNAPLPNSDHGTLWFTPVPRPGDTPGLRPETIEVKLVAPVDFKLNGIVSAGAPKITIKPCLRPV